MAVPVPEVDPILWPLAVYALLVVLLAAVMVVLPQLIGERHRQPPVVQPYESGMLTTRQARPTRQAAQFYLFALFFLVFDLEAVFLYAWAVAAPRLGWAGYVAIVVFVGVLLAALIYLWRDGALDWGTTAFLKHHPERQREAGRADHRGEREHEPQAG